MFDGFPKSSSGTPLIDYVRWGLLWLPFDRTSYHSWDEWDDETEQRLFAEKIEELYKPIAELLLLKRWTVGWVDQPLLFTGDTPLVKVNGRGKECGILSPGAMILFPLSPSRILFMTDGTGFKEDACHVISREQADACNNVIGENSPNFLFSSREFP